MDSPGAPSGSGRGEKRPASDAADASDLFKRGGPKSIRASAAPRVDAGGRPAGDAEGTGDDGSRARRPRADADAEDGDGAPESAGVQTGGSRARAEILADGGSLRSRPRLLAKFRALCGALARRLSAHADNITVAVWRAELGVAEVLRPRGKHLTRMGYQVGTRAFLFPEETAFLVETERCALLASAESAVPLSLRAVRALCVGTVRGSSKTSKTDENNALTVSGDAYALYAHLARRGYVVRRFGAPWSADARFWRSFSFSAKRETMETNETMETMSNTTETIETSNRAGSVSNTRVFAKAAKAGDARVLDPTRVSAEKTHARVGPWYLSARRWLDATNEKDVLKRRSSPNASAGDAASEGTGPDPDPGTCLTKRDRSSIDAIASRATNVSVSPNKLRLKRHTTLPSPAFRAYAPNGNFSRKNPGPVACVAFLAEAARAPSIRAAAEAALALRMRDYSELGFQESLEGKIAWASVDGGVVVTHGFETVYVVDPDE